MTQQIRYDAEEKIKVFVEQGTARTHKAEAERNRAKELMFQMEASMKQLREELQRLRLRRPKREGRH